jgi:hypothetical protein
MRAIVLIVRKVVPSILLLAALSFQSSAQSVSFSEGKIEVGLGLGPAFFLGDLGGARGIGKPFVKDLDIPLTKFAKGLYVNIYPEEWIGFRLALNQMKLEGDDDEVNLEGGREYSRWRRNQYFQSNIWEAYVGLELASVSILKDIIIPIQAI